MIDVAEGAPRDHGGGLDAAVALWGGRRDNWIDLSTGINPLPYPVPQMGGDIWTALPDRAAVNRLERAARRFWSVPETAAVVPAPGASALIARLPLLCPAGRVGIPGPTYNEHAAGFALHGWAVTEDTTAPVQVHVHPNNPDGRFAPDATAADLTIIDESFCDICPERSLIARTAHPGTIVLKSFGKFWGLAGLRLGFAIGHPDTMGRLAEHLGPWAVAGPALHVGALALEDVDWAGATRDRLAADAARLDTLMALAGVRDVRGTNLFRTYAVPNAQLWQDALAQQHVWSRVFPYDRRWLRLGLPHPDQWGRLEQALEICAGTVGGASAGTVGGATRGSASGVRPDRD